jgi:hypothetical protein
MTPVVGMTPNLELGAGWEQVQTAAAVDRRAAREQAAPALPRAERAPQRLHPRRTGRGVLLVLLARLRIDRIGPAFMDSRGTALAHFLVYSTSTSDMDTTRQVLASPPSLQTFLPTAFLQSGTAHAR